MNTVAVVGGGPAGLIAAERLAAAGCAVTVYERMPSPARKFLLAGRGGLNLTHSEPPEQLTTRYNEAAHALGPALRNFPPEALRAWCDELGQTTFIGSSGRVFPKAFKATPLLRAWLGRLGAAGVVLRTGHRWTGWQDAALRFETTGGPVLIEANATVLALGGASWPRLGSDGGWVATLDMPISPLRPANCGFTCAWSDLFRTRHEGAPLKRIAARFGDRVVRGEALVTADGIEGGAIYAHAPALRGAIAANGEAMLELDLRPDLERSALTAKLGGPGVSTANALRRAGLDAAAAGLVREQDPTRPLPDRIKTARIRLTGTRPIARAISTAGGVPFAALDGLMLPAHPGTFLAGEMLDWEAPTGGYLLQACFSTGWAAAGQALDWLASRQLEID